MTRNMKDYWHRWFAASAGFRYRVGGDQACTCTCTATGRPCMYCSFSHPEHVHYLNTRGFYVSRQIFLPVFNPPTADGYHRFGSRTDRTLLGSTAPLHHEMIETNLLCSCAQPRRRRAWSQIRFCFLWVVRAGHASVPKRHPPRSCAWGGAQTETSRRHAEEYVKDGPRAQRGCMCWSCSWHARSWRASLGKDFYVSTWVSC
jgi:hypothetical protein